MDDEKPVYFAVLHAAIRDRSKSYPDHGYYREVSRDDPRANEFRARFHNEHGMSDVPLGSDRERAESIVEHLNTAFNFGLVHAARRAKDSRVKPVLVGRMGHTNRNEESMP